MSKIKQQFLKNEEKPAYEILREIPLQELQYYTGVNAIANAFDYQKFAQELQHTESQLNEIDHIIPFNGTN
jgi:hypothetical protein